MESASIVRHVADSYSPILQSVLRSAIEATGAAQGWILETAGSELVVRASVGTDVHLIGQRVPLDAGFAGYVASSGQPIAMSPRRDDSRSAQGVAALVGTQPGSVLAVPCGVGDTIDGVLELVEKHGGGPFTFDDVEIATLLAGIAATALQADGQPMASVPSPQQIGADLARLASSDPTRYATLATFLATVLSDG